jgi:hypothetical protein
VTKEVEKEQGGDDSSTMMGIIALIENGGRHCPTTTMTVRPHSHMQSIQYLSYILVCNGN